MARYFLTASTITLNCGLITVNMTSKPQEHLWLLYSTHPLRVHSKRDVRTNTPVPHSKTYDMFIDGIVEQEEPGQTIQHTFHFNWPYGAQYLYFYTVNLGEGPTKQTRSGIFAYRLLQKAITEETWPYEGQSDWQWQVIDTTGLTTLYPRKGYGFITTVFPHSFSLRVSFSAMNLPGLQDTCNLTLKARINTWSNPDPEAAQEINIEAIFSNPALDTMSRNAYFSQHFNPCQANYRNIVTTFPAPGEAAIALTPAILNLSGLCNAGMDPIITTPTIDSMNIAVGLGSIDPTVRPYAMSIGNCWLETSDGKLEDITKTWAGQRIHPLIP